MKREAIQNIDFSHVRIVGAGLIGTSIALGLAQRGVTVEIHDDNQESLNLAKDLLEPHIGNRIPEIVVIAVPPERTLEVLKLEYERNHQATFIDVASVKNKLVRNVDTLSGLTDRFVGSHPMAGREVSGPSSAQADLFAGRAWILTPTSRSSQESIELAQQLVALLGATSYIMEADHHDELLAKISHLPQLLSTSLASSLVGLDDELALAGQGLRDMTRIANSDADLWSQIIMDNKDAVLRALRSFEEKFKSLTDAIATGDEVTLQRIFREGNVGRSKVSGKHGSQPRNYAYLLVVIQDEPGALSRLFLECAEISANIEDLSIEHSPGQLTGLITLAFSPEDAQRVQTHLAKKDWKVHLR
jgi:prephenate dehydrogenase